MSDDDFVLRDKRGYPLTSIFHQVPKRENQFFLVKLFDTIFPATAPFEIHDIDKEMYPGTYNFRDEEDGTSGTDIDEEVNEK